MTKSRFGKYLVTKDTFLYDLHGLRCPLVLLKAQKKKAELPANTSLIILSDDPLAPLDLAHYCQQHHFHFAKWFDAGICHLSIL